MWLNRKFYVGAVQKWLEDWIFDRNSMVVERNICSCLATCSIPERFHITASVSSIGFAWSCDTACPNHLRCAAVGVFPLITEPFRTITTRCHFRDHRLRKGEEDSIHGWVENKVCSNKSACSLRTGTWLGM